MATKKFILERRLRRQKRLAKHGKRPSPTGRRPPHVAIITPVFADGGTERWAVGLFKSTKDEVRWSQLVVLSQENISEHSVKVAKNYTRVRYGHQAAVEAAESADVTIIWGTGSKRFWNPLSRSRLVVVAHGDGSSSFTRAVLEANKGADAFVCVSREAFGAVPRTRRRDAHTILNGVDIDRLEESQNTREQLKKAWGVPNKKILGFVGRLSWEKNPYLAIAAVRHLPPNWHLVIAGDGPEAEDVRRYAFDRARGRVLFLGVRRDVGDIMRSFDTLIAPSTQEGFGFSVAEAWSVGCPVVSTPVGIAGIWPHFVQVIQSPVHGIQKDVGSIREVLLNQDGTQAARAVLSECSPSTIRRAREHVQSTLSLDAFGKQWSELLYKLSRQTVTRKPKPQVDTAHEPRRWLASVSGTSKQQSVGIGSVRRKRTSRSAG